MLKLNNLDLKDWALIVSVCIAIVFSINFFMSSSGYKKVIRGLEGENKNIERERDSLKTVNKRLTKEAEVYVINIEKYQNRIDSIQKLISKKDIEISKLKSTANGYKSAYEKTKKEIEKLEKEPIKRVGDDLLNSLKEKTKKDE